MASPYNYFPLKDQMLKMGEIIKYAKEDGYHVTMAPPQSYLDPSSSAFSRYVNHTDPNRTWHPGFSYFGRNLYAFWLAKYGEYIDLVSVQFYESYSRAAMEIAGGGDERVRMTPEGYLQKYVWDLNANNQTFYVDFGSDPEITPDILTSGYVPLPVREKLVWGFGNGWTKMQTESGNEKNVYFPPECIQAAYQNLLDSMVEPRGLMFWDIHQEGLGGVVYAKEFNDILHIREPIIAGVSSS